MPASVGNTRYTMTGTNTPGWVQPSIYLQKIFNISPVDTPLFTMSRNVTATDVVHHWWTRSLDARSSADTLLATGGDYTYKTVKQPVRLENTCAIQHHGVEVDMSAARGKYYAAGKLFNDQWDLRSKDHKNSMEHLFWNGTETFVTTSTKRCSAGILAFTLTNASASNKTDCAAGASFTESLFQTGQEVLWSKGHMGRVSIQNATLRKTFASFSGSADSVEDMANTKRRTFDVIYYQSAFGTTENVLCRDIPDGGAGATADFLIYDPMMVCKAWYRPTSRRKIETAGDYMRSAMVTEWTQQYDEPDTIFYGKSVAT